MDSQLQNDELQALLDASFALKIPASSLKPQNPFDQRFDTPTSRNLQMWLRENRPSIAARLSGAGGHEFSLAAIAAERGLTEHTTATRQEWIENDETFATQAKANAEEFERRMMAEMEAKADEMAAKRGVDLAAPPNFASAGKFQKYFADQYQQQQLDAQNDA